MTALVKREIRLYGRLRDAGLGDAATVELPPGATARQALAALQAALGRRGFLLEGCAIATEDAVLAAADVLPPRGALAVLPPVCGG